MIWFFNLEWTFVFDMCVVGCESKNEHQKNQRRKEIGIGAHLMTQESSL
jgi:hypothetical protein